MFFPAVSFVAESPEAAQIDDTPPLVVDNQQEQRVGADVDDGPVHSPSCFATMTFMISFVPA